MSKHEVHAYDYVNCPYDRVAEMLKLDAVGVFQRATATATTRARALVSTMRASIGPIELGADVVVRVQSIEDEEAPPFGATTRVRLAWHAVQSAELFPTMQATLSVYALSPEETQIDFRGAYVAPLGALGTAFDKVVGRRIAEAAVHRFVEEIAARLRIDVAAASDTRG